jgi:leucyl aminopeptidase
MVAGRPRSALAEIVQARSALFLKRFIAHDPTWIHLDLSAGRHKGGLGAIPTDTTGFGVDFTLALLADPAFAW